jgi:hypothetical protein
MVLGVILLGTLAMTTGATILGAGFRGDAVSTLLAVLLGTAIPIYAFRLCTRICRDPHFRLLSEER